VTRTYARPQCIQLRFFLSDPVIRTRFAHLIGAGMYRYRHNKRLRAAFLLDKRMGWVRG